MRVGRGRSGDLDGASGGPPPGTAERPEAAGRQDADMEGAGAGRWRRAKRNAGPGRIPNIWRSGRRMRPACGASASNAAISGSASKYSNWLRAAAAFGVSRSSQPDRRGQRGG